MSPYNQRTSRFALVPELFEIASAENEQRRYTSVPSCRTPAPSSSINSSLNDDILLTQWGLFLHPKCLDLELPEDSEEETPPSASVTHKASLFASLRGTIEDALVKHQEEKEREAALLKQQIEEKERREREAREERDREAKRKEEKEEKQKEEKQKEQKQKEEKEKEEKKKEEKRQIEQIKTIEKQTIVALSEPKSASSGDPFIDKQLADVRVWDEYLEGDFQTVRNDSRPEVKRFRMETKKTINVTINQLASTSTQIESVSQQLLQLLHNHQSPDPQRLPLFRFVIASLLSSILENAEIQLISNAKSVWSYGMLLSRLSGIPEFQQSFQCAIFHKCTYCMPFYYTKLKSMSEAEFHNLRGQRNEESELQYFQRMSALLRLWLVFLVCRKDRQMYWSWWSRFLSTKPKRISSSLLFAALDVSAFFGLHFFPKQFQKLLFLSMADFFPKLTLLQAKDTGGALAASMTQTSLLLDKFRKEGRFEVPEGFQMKHHTQEISDAT